MCVCVWLTFCFLRLKFIFSTSVATSSFASVAALQASNDFRHRATLIHDQRTKTNTHTLPVLRPAGGNQMCVWSSGHNLCSQDDDDEGVFTAYPEQQITFALDGQSLWGKMQEENAGESPSTEPGETRTPSLAPTPNHITARQTFAGKWNYACM